MTRGGRAKANVRLSGLTDVRGSSRGYVIARFGESEGLQILAGRDVQVDIEYAELAQLLGAIPASQLDDAAGISLMRVYRWLRANGRKEQE